MATNELRRLRESALAMRDNRPGRTRMRELLFPALSAWNSAEPETAARRSQAQPTASVPLGARVAISSIRDCGTYFFRAWKKNGAATYLGELAALLRMALSRSRLR